MNDKKHILVVDDDATTRYFLMQQLTRAGYQVLLAKNGLEALSLIRADHSRPDLILLDLLMPQYSGQDLLEKLKELPYIIPVILMSAADRSMIYQVVEVSDYVTYLPKPFGWQELSTLIDQLLSGGNQ